MARCSWEFERIKDLGYAVVCQMCDDYHNAYRLGDRFSIEKLDFLFKTKDNIERLTFYEQCGEQVYSKVKAACRKLYGKFKEVKKRNGTTFLAKH